MTVRILHYLDSIRAGFVFPMPGGITATVMILLCTLGIAGCMLSITPIIPYSEHVYEPRLVGSWELDDGTSRAVITKVTEDAYSIEYVDEGGVSHLGGRLGMLNGRLILDVWPTPGEEEVPQTYAELMVQGHFPLIIELEDNQIRVSTFEPDALTDAIESGRISIPHEASGERLLLRGNSNEVRAALSSYLNMQGLLSDEGTWRRVPD